VNIGLYSYMAAFIAFTVLTVVLAVSWRNRPFSVFLLVASALTALWAGMIAGSTLLAYPQVKLMQLTEVTRNAAWLFMLIKLLGARLEGSDHFLASPRWTPWFALGFLVIASLLPAAPLLSEVLALPPLFYRDVAFAIWLFMAILGLLCLEQIFRNSSESELWSIKLLCLGLGLLFAYDFFMYAEALLFRELDPALWQARGVVVAFIAPLIALSVARTDRSPAIRLSRHVVFHTVTLMAAGTYLLLMALVGYFLQFLGGTWSGALQIIFLCGSGLLLLLLLFSGQVRARIRVWLSKNFFSYKYDYRTEWLQFTQTLADSGENVPESIIRAVAKLTQSPAGLLWAKNENGSFEFVSHWEMAEPADKNGLQKLANWLLQTQWVIDLDEWRGAPDIYDQLELPTSITDIPNAWLIIPLFFGDQLQGILLLRKSNLHPGINWEDRDLLKVAGRQAASHLAQHQANQALVESRQFEAFNRLSAYVVHDLKNILAQQSLIVSNAEKHKHNPEFVDDMIATVNNSVTRMTSLMEQMRSGLRGSEASSVDLGELIQEVVDARSEQQPQPSLKLESERLTVQSNREQLYTVFSHLIQNAQEATRKSGSVTVRLYEESNIAVVEIEDNGIGMDPDFIKNRLFKPFDSTKGLTGMGIGAFESREFIRSMGGDIVVESQPSRGSIFRVRMPFLKVGKEVE